MCAGYGRQLTLSSLTVLKGTPATKALRRYLGHRLEMLAACLDYGGVIVTPKPFYKFVETTEKAALSFVIGCIGTHIAAKLWMMGGGVRMSKFLHSGIYSKSTTVLPSALVKLTKINPKGKIPDFLVQDSSRGWHAFESKGGVANKRWIQIVMGLKQLANVTTISLASAKGPAPKPKTTVCVHTVLADSLPLSITLVDPPGVSNERAAGAGLPELSITLVPGVAELLLALEAIEWFHGLEDGAINIKPRHQDAQLWVFKGSSAFRGLILGLPRALLDREDSLRWKLALYLAVQEALELSSKEVSNYEQHLAGVALPSDRSRFIDILTQGLAKLQPMETALTAAYNPSSIYDAISNALQTPGNRLVGTLHAWAHCLQIANFAGQILRIRRSADRDMVVMRLYDPEAQTIVSEGGLYIEAVGRRQEASSEEVA